MVPRLSGRFVVAPVILSHGKRGRVPERLVKLVLLYPVVLVRERGDANRQSITVEADGVPCGRNNRAARLGRR
jgi:hypothetical protein